MSTVAIALASLLSVATAADREGDEVGRELRAIRTALYPKGDAPLDWEREFLRKLGEDSDRQANASDIREIRMEMERRKMTSGGKASVGGSSAASKPKSPSKVQGATGLGKEPRRP